jgi:DNA-directed RNA polymerase specialized sigma subunit
MNTLFHDEAFDIFSVVSRDVSDEMRERHVYETERQTRLKWRRRVLKRFLNSSKLKLPPMQRAVFDMALQDSLGPTEIGRRLGISQQAASLYLALAVKKIQNVLL